MAEVARRACRRSTTPKWEWRVWFPTTCAPSSLVGTSARRGTSKKSEVRQDVYWDLGSTLAPIVGLKEREANAFELKTRVAICERSGMEFWQKQKICDISRTGLLETRNKLDADRYVKALGLKKLARSDCPNLGSRRQRKHLCALRSIATATLVDTGLLNHERVAQSVIPTLAAPVRTCVTKKRWKTYDSSVGAKVECVDVDIRMPWSIERGAMTLQRWTSFAVEGNEDAVRGWHDAHFTPWWEEFHERNPESTAIVAGYPEFVAKIAQSQR